MYCPAGGKDVVKLLVGNKVDMEDARDVSRKEGAAWARANGMLFIEASAKTKKGIQQVFHEVVQKIMDNPVLLANTNPGGKKRRGVKNLDKNRSSADEGAGLCC